jgi:hypothetical protein
VAVTFDRSTRVFGLQFKWTVSGSVKSGNLTILQML